MHTLLSNIQTLSTEPIMNKRVLLRVDFNVTLTEERHISDDARITQALPTITKLLKGNNQLILVSHLDRPKGRDPKLSLSVVAERLQSFLPNHTVVLIDDFQSQEGKKQLNEQKKNEVCMLENIRYYEGEKEDSPEFAKELAALGDVYVNDAFGVSHRNDASLTQLPHFLPAFAGLLMEKEINAIAKVLETPKKPLIAIIGGAKISTKLHLIQKLAHIADYVLIGGGLANNLLKASGFEVGKSLIEEKEIENTQKLLSDEGRKKILFPSDVVVDDNNGGEVKKIEDVGVDDVILDIGPETQAKYGSIITTAKTIIWNGPLGYTEKQQFRRGTDFVFYSIAANQDATSIVGGGDTIAAISKKEYLEKISHISTGGGAMLELIENGTLPGLEALRQS
jgi:phosphoglycerate kinase